MTYIFVFTGLLSWCTNAVAVSNLLHLCIMPTLLECINPILSAWCMNAALANYSPGLHSWIITTKEYIELKHYAALKGLPFDHCYSARTECGTIAVFPVQLHLCRTECLWGGEVYGPVYCRQNIKYDLPTPSPLLLSRCILYFEIIWSSLIYCDGNKRFIFAPVFRAFYFTDCFNWELGTLLI